MDDLLHYCDTYFLDNLYAKWLPSRNALPGFAPGFGAANNGTMVMMDPGAWMPDEFALPSQWEQRDNIYRQMISIFVISTLLSYVIYFVTALTCWYFFFDRSSLQRNPKFRKDQIRAEIKESMTSIPLLAILHIPVFLLQIRGYTKMYGPGESPGLWYEFFQVPLFLLVTESTYYWIHRALHSPLLYKRMHKNHHKWVFATPFAGFAFHPVDGFLQGSPFTIFTHLFPMNKKTYTAFFAFNAFYTTILHEGELLKDSKVFNGPSNHTIHHQRLNQNLGQWTTMMDRIAGTYVNPGQEVTPVKQHKAD